MKYITVRETAEKWGITVRQVQRLLAAGRLDGALRHGRTWLVPEQIEKPSDLRKGGAETDIREGNAERFMPLICAAYEPGKLYEWLESMEDEGKHATALAEVAFHKGDMEAAERISEGLIRSDCLEERAAGYSLTGFTRLFMGDADTARGCFESLSEMLSFWGEDREESERKALYRYITAVLDPVLDRNSRIPPIKTYLRSLPEGVRMYACFDIAYRELMSGNAHGAIGIAEMAIALQEKLHPVSTIHLWAVEAMSLIALKRMNEARECFQRAWALAEPDGLIAVFSKYHLLLQGLTEVVIMPVLPDMHEKIMRLAMRMESGRLVVRAGGDKTGAIDELSQAEYAVAALVAAGWKNAEISLHLGLSQNTVKWHISNVFQKLHVVSRKELGILLNG